jgi:hypothetical protein
MLYYFMTKIGDARWYAAYLGMYRSGDAKW